MSDVEFLEPDGSVLAPDEGVSVRRQAAPRVSGAVAAVLAVAGGALAVFAPFRAAYRLAVHGIADDGPFGFSLNGWGRYHAGPLAAVDVHQHGPRLGIVYCAAAGAVVVGIVLWLVSRRTRRVGSALVVFAAGVVASSAAAVLLDAQAVLDSYRTVIGARNGSRLSLQFGGVLWLGVASTILLIAAVVVRSAGSGRRMSDPPTGEPATTRPLIAEHPHHDEELLG